MPRIVSGLDIRALAKAGDQAFDLAARRRQPGKPFFDEHFFEDLKAQVAFLPSDPEEELK